MRKLILVLAGLISCVLLRDGCGWAAGPSAFAKLEPAADAMISWWDKTKNFGTTDQLSLYGTSRPALFRFDLSAVPNETIVSAKFYVTFQKVGADYAINPKRFFVFDLGKEFSETEVTYIQSSTGQNWVGEGMKKFEDYYLLPYCSKPILASTPGEYSVDLTNLVQMHRKQGRSQMSIVFMSPELNAGGIVYSREYADATKRPRLEVEYSSTTPEASVPEIQFSQFGSVTVDGSASSLPGGAKAGLAYQWTIDKPAPGSTYKPGDGLGTDQVLSFNPDQPGYYELRLSVQNGDTGQRGEAIAKVVAGLNPHPRLHINQSLLSQIQYLRGTGDPIWTRFHNWLKAKPTYSDIEGGIVSAYLLAHLVTGERQYFDWTWDRFKSKIYKNGVDRSEGLLTLIELYKGDNHSAAFQGGPLIAQIAQLYDWGYAQLTGDQRSDLISWMNDAVAYNQLRNSQALLYFRNDGAAFTYGIGAAAYATLGENPEAVKQFQWFRTNWDETLKALDVMGKGGATGEGNAYGSSPTATSIIRIANMIYHASGEDLFMSHPWFKQRLAYDAFATYPGLVGGVGSPTGGTTFPEQASIGGDGRRGGSWHSVSLRPNGLMLSRRFAGTEEANTWNWVFRQPEIDRAGDVANCFYDVLYYSPRPPLTKPKRLSFFDPSMGYAYIRSDWNSANATWIAFWAGPHLDTHQHLDQGGFAIFKKRDLAPKTGHYDINVNSAHDLAWYTRTVSANALLIGDPNEVFRHFISGAGCDAKGSGASLPTPDNSAKVCIPNDGGQRTMSPLSLAPSNVEYFETYRDTFEVAKVTSFSDTGRVVTLVADITNAYNNPRYTTPGSESKVHRVYRKLVYLRDLDTVLIADTVESRDPNFKKKWLLHALEQVEIQGNEQVISDGESVFTGTDQARIVVEDTKPSDKNQQTFDLRSGYAALLVKTIFPKDFRYRKVGGREPSDTAHPDMYQPDSYNFNVKHFHRHVKDFWVKDFSEGVQPNHQSANWLPESPNETANATYVPIFGPGYGRWRLEVEPASANATDYFLNVLKPTVNPSAVLPQIERFEDSDFFGAAVSSGGTSYRVLFSKQDLSAPKVALKYSGSVVPGGRLRIGLGEAPPDKE